MNNETENAKPGQIPPHAYPILLAVKSLLDREPWGPTYAEIAREAGCSESRAYDAVRELKGLGWVTLVDGKARSIRIAKGVRIPRRKTSTQQTQSA